MGYKTDKDNSKILENKTGDELCKTCLFTYTDLKKNYGYLYYPNKEHHDIKKLCFDKIKDKLFLELIHPKYYYYMYINKEKYNNFVDYLINYYINKTDKTILNNDFELEAYQKQGIFGITDYTVDYRMCHYFFFMGFRQFYKTDDNTMGHSIINYYSYTLNKVVNYCMSKRDNLFAVRFANNGILPWHKPFDNPHFERDFIKTLSGDDFIFLGVIQKKLKEYTPQYPNDNTTQVFIVYSTLYNGIFTLDETLSNVMDNIIKWPITFTFLELHQLCNYLGMYGYMYKKNKYDIYFSKFDIFNDNQIYDGAVYTPLSSEQFNQVLIELRKELIPISCFKFPPLKNVPKCALKDIINVNNEKSSKTEILLDRNINYYELFENKCINPQMYIAKYDSNNMNICSVSKDHRTNPPNSYVEGYK